MFQHSLDTLEMLGLDTGTIEVVENIGTELSYVKLGRGYCLLSEEAIQAAGNCAAYRCRRNGGLMWWRSGRWRMRN